MVKGKDIIQFVDIAGESFRVLYRSAKGDILHTERRYTLQELDDEGREKFEAAVASRVHPEKRRAS